MLLRLWNSWRDGQRQSQTAAILQRRAIHDDIWRSSVAALPFLAQLQDAELIRLRQLTSLFLDGKEFSGAQGFAVTDAHAVLVAVQACLPILHIAPPDRPDLALAWYDGFVGIVLHADEVRARREWVDEDGIAHSGSEAITGEILGGGPLMLSWSDVKDAGALAKRAYNVVIHEFIHVMDVRDGEADGCPPMPRDQRRQWLITLRAEFERFQEANQAWLRFGSMGNKAGQAESLQDSVIEPVIDAYGSESIDEFFAVAAEAYFVQRERFALAHPQLLALFDSFFRIHNTI